MTWQRKLYGYLTLIVFAIIYIGIVLPFKNIYYKRIQDFRYSKNYYIKHSEDSPLEKPQLKYFTKLKYFPIEKKFRKEAGVEFYKQRDTVRMTVFNINQMEEDYFLKCGKVVFQHEGKVHKLDFFRHLKEKTTLQNYFIPFYDITNKSLSYQNGRYLDFKVDTSKVIQTIDFNLTYNPFCAYNQNYKCPIPPKNNFLPFAVEAGEMSYK